MSKIGGTSLREVETFAMFMFIFFLPTNVDNFRNFRNSNIQSFSEFCVLFNFFFLFMELTVQSEKAFQKQQQIFLGNKRVLLKKQADNKKPLTLGERKKIRYWKEVGMGFSVPKRAIEGVYVDKKCPFTGNISIRGRILQGVVKSYKMKRTLIVRRDYMKWVKKYKRYEKRHKNIAAHCSPCFEIKEGDKVVIGECRPLSKTVRFNVLKVLKGTEEKKKFKRF